MLNRAPLFPGEPLLALLALRPTGYTPPPAVDVSDALADPDIVTIAPTLYELLPLGSAWSSPDGAAFEDSSLLGGFLRGLAGDLATLYRRTFGIALESTASTLVDSLEDWEFEYGLPDPCFHFGDTPAQRLATLLTKIRSAGTIARADFVDIAAFAGFDVTITEPNSFECGISDCGGIDEMGGAIEYYWIVKVSGIAVYHFEAGVSETGVDALTDFTPATALECLFRSLAPAWTRPIFDYS